MIREKNSSANAELIEWVPDPAIANIVTSWPARIDAARARALGLLPDSDFESIIKEYLKENPWSSVHSVGAY